MPESKKIFDVFAIEENEKKDATYWRNIGVAFENKDGSVNVKLYMFPGLQLQIRERQERKENEPVRR
jgi:hypothetical protein